MDPYKADEIARLRSSLKEAAEFGDTYTVGRCQDAISAIEERAALRSSALRSFKAALGCEPGANLLDLLSSAGWNESCPSRDYWSFSHPSYPGVFIRYADGAATAE